ncbi:MAG: mannose-1-phosphate guanylyltransferase/mannose-6-phosphate isomerase [Rhodobacteraceae bacterium]|nr:mannose-1-phosphate guanylyltransferase/mannose-6-phosphate isomerase [Paracoccaceae bacterium]
MTKIHPLVICGGNGTRLWPMSRAQSPKQFQRVGGTEGPTFFQATLERHRCEGYAEPVVVSSVTHRRTVQAQLAELNCAADVIYEPMGRNTGPAVLAAALHLAKSDPDAVMLVIPADHVIDGDMNTTIFSMIDAARHGYIVTYGITPRYAESGFGYITDGGSVPGYAGLHKVDRFVEKPPIEKARLLVDSKKAYWASGISMFSARTIIEEYQKYDMPTYRTVKQAVEQGISTGSGLVLDRDFFRQATAEPTESVVFEKTDRIALAPLDVNWNDVGSWTAMYGVSAPNADGNVFQGDVIAVDTHNSMIRSETRLVAVVGMSDVIVIDTPDAVLVTKAGACQDVKKIAEQLKAGKRPEIEKHSTSEHAWGKMKQVLNREQFNLSTLNIKAGGSLQVDPAYEREAIVVKGQVDVSNGTRHNTLREGDRLLLDSKTPSRLVNRTGEVVELVFLTMEDRQDTLEAVAVEASLAGAEGSAAKDIGVARYA